VPPLYAEGEDLTSTGRAGMKLRKPREGQKSTVEWCNREGFGIPFPPCKACHDPCDGKHLKTETHIFRNGRWELLGEGFTPDYEPEEVVDGKLKKFTINQEEEK